MNSLKGSSIAEIKAVPGLYISDRFAARSLSLLQSSNITHVLSVTRPEDRPTFTTEDAIEQRHINIDDDPTEDLLTHLVDTCDWIESCLKASPADTADHESAPGGVLVHCTQGISRSGTVIIAFLMRKFSMPYVDALALARESRFIISPNSGFERQLQVWDDCKYNLSLPSGTEKASYKLWRSEMDALIRRGEGAVAGARASSMASMAASFGRRRLEMIEKRTQKKAEQEDSNDGIE